ncbi:PAS domain-containing protein [Bdellovibrionota bacterium FG-2]
MARPTPIDQESSYSLDELFFSRTDPRGIIISGNEVFVRVSKHSKESLVGSPHNIIRHPDVPKTVFFLLWKTIQAGRPLCAYVKNMAADGSYYWVFATIFPIEEGFLSIRIKQSTALFEKIPPLYKQILEKERSGGVEAGVKFLNETLNTLGFKDYEAFSRAALLAEVYSHSSHATNNLSVPALKEEAKNQETSQLTQSLTLCQECVKENLRALQNLQSLSKTNQVAAEKSAFIGGILKSLDLLTVNMTTAAKRIGAAGLTLVAVADAIQKSAAEFKADLSSFKQSTEQVQNLISSSEFRIAATQIQVEMIAFYLRENLTTLNSGQTAAAGEIEDRRQNLVLLLLISSEYVTHLLEGTGNLQKLLSRLNSDVDSLRATVNSFELIRKAGTIEAAQLHDGGVEFKTHFSDIDKLVKNTASQLAAFSESLNQSLYAVSQIIPATRTVSNALFRARKIMNVQ